MKWNEGNIFTKYRWLILLAVEPCNSSPHSWLTWWCSASLTTLINTTPACWASSHAERERSGGWWRSRSPWHPSGARHQVTVPHSTVQRVAIARQFDNEGGGWRDLKLWVSSGIIEAFQCVLMLDYHLCQLSDLDCRTVPKAGRLSTSPWRTWRTTSLAWVISSLTGCLTWPR